MPKFKKALSLALGFLLILPNLAYGAESTSSVTVPAHLSDYQLSFTKVTPGTTFSQGDVIEYKLTYGAYLSYNTTVTIEGQWYEGVVQSDNSGVEVLDYVPGSATDAYGGVAPVIDTINHKITWTISSFPGTTTNQTVNFKVKLNSNYTGSSNVDFDVAGRLFAPGVTFPDQVITSTLKGTPQNSSSPTPTPTPTSSPAPTTTTQTPPTYQIIDVRTVTNDSGSIYVATNQPTQITIIYGTSPSQLNQTQKSNSYSLATLIKLAGLKANTTYYYKFIALNQAGNQVTSDLFSFTTSSEIPFSEIDTGSLVATSDDVILFSNSGQKSEQENTLIIPEQTVFQIKFALKNNKNVKKVQAVIRLKQASMELSQVQNKSKVLGAVFIPQADAATDIVNLVETEPGIYTGKLKTSPLHGTYEIIARIYDTKGNVTEQKIANLRVINKFTVLSKNDSKPVPSARVYLYIFASGKYILIPTNAISAGNPAFTDELGKLSIALPAGKYKATISSLKFKDKTVEFILGNKETENFPIVYLESEKFSLIKLINYYGHSVNDVFLYYTSAYAKVLTGSSSFFDLVALATLFGLVLLTLFAFGKRHRIPFSEMVSYFYYLRDHKNMHDSYIHGVVFDHKDNPIPGANVYLSNKDSEEITSHAQTNKRGEFYFKKGSGDLLMIMAKGYKTTPLLPYSGREHLKFKAVMEKEQSKLNLWNDLTSIFDALLGASFELLLFASLVFELLFINSFGLLRTAPFLAVSIFDLLLWSLHIKHKERES